MSYDLEHKPYLSRFLLTDEHKGFLDQISHPAALLVAAVLGFEGALIAVSVSEAVKTGEAPPAAIRVEIAKPPQYSIQTPDRLFFLRNGLFCVHPAPCLDDFDLDPESKWVLHVALEMRGTLEASGDQPPSGAFSCPQRLQCAYDRYFGG